MNRDKLIQLSTEGKIKDKKKFLKEADETIEMICAEYNAKKFDEANEQLTEIFVAKFSEMMEQLELVKNKLELEKDRPKNELLKNDVKKLVGYITPFVPYIGLISGGLTVGGHVISKKTAGTGGTNEVRHPQEPKEVNRKKLHHSIK